MRLTVSRRRRATGNDLHLLPLSPSRLILCPPRDERNLALTFVVLGRLALAQGDSVGAGTLWTEGLHIGSDVQDKYAIGCLLGSFVALAAVEQQPVRALRLAAADAVFRMVGIPLPLATGELVERGGHKRCRLWMPPHKRQPAPRARR